MQPPWSPNSGLERYERDVLANPGVTAVVVWLGFNDIDASPPYDDGGTRLQQIKDGLEDLVAALKAPGRQVILGTISPLAGSSSTTVDLNRELRRLLLNAAIRNGEFGANGYVDIDAAVRDPNTTWKLRAAYSLFGGNHFTPAGNLAIAEAVYAKRNLF